MDRMKRNVKWSEVSELNPFNLIHTHTHTIPQLSKIYEAKGDIDQACDVVQDVHVETYGALSKKEKVIVFLINLIPNIHNLT